MAPPLNPSAWNWGDIPQMWHPDNYTSENICEQELKNLSPLPKRKPCSAGAYPNFFPTALYLQVQHYVTPLHRCGQAFEVIWIKENPEQS